MILSSLWQNEQNDSWLSKEFDWEIKSPLASESLVFSEAVDAGILIAAMLQEIFRLTRLAEVLFKTRCLC